ncbi:hypothetical protein F5Y15DRAFT_370025 [Xylariaceae sp. FL0016]|nr:hypothetical protein F5Y15DRAFT_370025 [Xylariaceae sp. FL0016]
MEHSGHHIADFLAFRAILNHKGRQRAQFWLSQTDIQKRVEDCPKTYVHGNDKRVVDKATDIKRFKYKREWHHRFDNIKYEPSINSLKKNFLDAVKEKAEVVHGMSKEHDLFLGIIVCGLTSTDQDIFFGEQEIDYNSRLTAEEIRSAIPEPVNTVLITPALFSAGWQVNPFFCSSPVQRRRGDRIEFLARQFGGTFTKDIVAQFLGWDNPLLDTTKIDGSIREVRDSPAPVRLTNAQEACKNALELKIHSSLLGRLSPLPRDHSFSFDDAKDEWVQLIGMRREVPLTVQEGNRDSHERYWNIVPKLEDTDVQPVQDGFEFLGNAFGGSRASQLYHIEHVINESFANFPTHWASEHGKKLKGDFLQFLSDPGRHNHEPTVREIFSSLEHRATAATVGDRIVQSLDLPKPLDKWCRHLTFHEGPNYVDIGAWNDLKRSLSHPYVPPGVNFNHLSRIQAPFFLWTLYVGTAVGKCDDKADVLKKIKELLSRVEEQQIRHLLHDHDLRDMCKAWLESIDMPIRHETEEMETLKNEVEERTVSVSDSPKAESDGVLTTRDMIAAERDMSKVARQLQDKIQACKQILSSEGTPEALKAPISSGLWQLEDRLEELGNTSQVSKESHKVTSPDDHEKKSSDLPVASHQTEKTGSASGSYQTSSRLPMGTSRAGARRSNPIVNQPPRPPLPPHLQAIQSGRWRRGKEAKPVVSSPNQEEQEVEEDLSHLPPHLQAIRRGPRRIN